MNNWKNWVLGVVGSALIMVSSWAGNKLYDHESRISAMQATYQDIKEDLQRIERKLDKLNK